MSTQELAMSLFQDIYYDSKDRGDIKRAVSAFHPHVEWSHAQIWAHHEYSQGARMELKSRAELEALLLEREDKMAEENIRHKVRRMVCEDNVGAFLGAIEGKDRQADFMVWFELKDDLISRYIARPLA